MQADSKEIVQLLHLQQVELDLIRAHKQFEELPQRKKIAGLRQKKQELAGKSDQVAKMLREVEWDKTRINDEDERLVLRASEIQEKIDSARGDYRVIESLTKELNGIAKQRNTLESNLNATDEKFKKIKTVQKQVKDISEEVELQEQEQITVFQKEGGDLQKKIVQLESLREVTVKDISPETLKTFDKKSKKFGGIALSRLQKGHCSVCRNQFDEGKLLQIKAQAPLSECPACKRMMVVIDE